ncbi:unnamed protein product [Clavelina lepadiformis]|uniref:DNA-directed primase/polymerase protein n=1 Tax=Clavelina lepadiformis TaxID=159417 RepID=A0ABP0EXV8_CLALP
MIKLCVGAMIKKLKNKHQCNIEKRMKDYQENPVKMTYKPRLSDVWLPPPLWKLFYKQSDAIDYAKTQKHQHAFVFSFEIDNSRPGARRYVVASLEEFWSYYIQMAQGKRHFYELIQSGALCHLYFDLEFDKTLNKTKNTESMIQMWVTYTCKCLYNEFKVSCSRRNVVELDSTTETKFSQHLIWHVPNAAFKNNLEAGNFVKKICCDLLSYLKLKNDASSNVDAIAKHWITSLDLADDLSNLLVTSSSGEKQLFVDQSVYSNNRNFRLFHSSKKGKIRELELSEKCQFPFEPVNIRTTCCMHHMMHTSHHMHHMTSPSKTKKLNGGLTQCRDELIFFSSFITNVFNRDDLTILEMPEHNKKSNAYVLPYKNSQLVSGISHNIEYDESCIPEDNDTDVPFKELHAFVTDLIKQFNSDAFVRMQRYFPTTKTISYEITGTRYCGNIGREHKSNGILYVANLKTMYCYQKCHDYECRNYRSDPIPFPEAVKERLKNSFNELSDDEMVKEVEIWERNQNHTAQENDNF